MVRQTGCRHCDQDIENFWPYRRGEWRDRGNNTTCPTPEGDAGLKHEPYIEKLGTIAVGLQYRGRIKPLVFDEGE
jgi:hypothetical protein